MNDFSLNVIRKADNTKEVCNFMRIDTGQAWNSARAIEKARPLTWINASNLPLSQIIRAFSANRQATAGDTKERKLVWRK